MDPLDSIVAIAADGPDLDPAVYGAKAAGLQRLIRLGLAVPLAVAVPVAVAEAVTSGNESAREALRSAIGPLGRRLAVRSGAAVSLPGAYDSVLDVEPSAVDAAVTAVVQSAGGLRAESIATALGHDRVPDTAVIVQRLVDATIDDRSGAGAATSRDPVTGKPGATGSFAWQVRGDAVMADRIPVRGLDAIGERAPDVLGQLVADLARLDAELDSPVEVEFTIERGELFYLQLRTVVVHADANSDNDSRLPADSVVIAEGQPASAGVGRGMVHVDVDDALDAVDRGESVILVLETTAPADVTAMVRSAAVLTVYGGRESHAAVVTRSAGVPAVVAVGGLQIGEDHIALSGRRIEVGTELLVDGTTGRVALPANGS